MTLGEGAAQSVTGTAVDAAGNTEHAAVTGVNVDETAPALTGAPTTAPNAAGWYRDDVLVQWTCHDDLSGISGACPGDSTVTGEGDNLSASQSVADLAGNVSDATVSAIHIDRTAPTTTSDAPSAWQNTDVMVTFTAHDGLSGVAATRYVIDGGATHDGTVAAQTLSATSTVLRAYNLGGSFLSIGVTHNPGLTGLTDMAVEASGA